METDKWLWDKMECLQEECRRLRMVVATQTAEIESLQANIKEILARKPRPDRADDPAMGDWQDYSRSAI